MAIITLQQIQQIDVLQIQHIMKGYSFVIGH